MQICNPTETIHMRSLPSLSKTSTLLKGLPKKLLTIGAAAAIGVLAATSASAAPVTYTIQAERRRQLQFAYLWCWLLHGPYVDCGRG
jgi:hypothetical protein